MINLFEFYYPLKYDKDEFIFLLMPELFHASAHGRILD